jgi:ABC-type antimicrobial peptide transport system ATPase subunit
MYADDLVLLAIHKQLSVATKYVNEDFRNLQCCTHDKELVMNEMKTKLIHMCTPLNSDRNTTIELIFHDTECIHKREVDVAVCGCVKKIESVSHHMYVGAIIDREFSWQPHID